MSSVVFCGFGELGYNCLKKLINMNYHIKYILTHVDDGDKSVDRLAQENNIRFFYSDLRHESKLIQYLDKNDILISVNYRYILPKWFFNSFKYAFNIHGSLLPRYRGRTPHVWAIINGEKKTGITSHIIEEGVDTGDIIVQKEIEIDKDDTGYSLLKKLENLYPDIMIKSLNKLNSTTQLVKQNEQEASYYGKREPIMGYINFYDKAYKIINFIRAQSYPYPGAYCYLPNGEKLIIDNIKISEKQIDINFINIGVPVFKGNTYYIKCIDAILQVTQYRKGD